MMYADIIRRNGSKFANKLANIDEGHRFTYAETNKRVNRIADAFQHIGIKKGDRVAALLYNCVEYQELYFACFKTGIILVPINYRLLSNELLYILNNSEPKALIFDSEFIDTVNNIKDGLNSVKNFIVVGEQAAHDSFDEFENLINDFPDDEPDAVLSENDTVFIMYTSGTTGYPKGVMITQKNIMEAVINQFAEVCPLLDDVLFTLPPLYHLAGLLTCLVYFCRGCTNMTIRRFDVPAVLEWAEREKPTAIHLVPAMQNMIINYPDSEKFDISGIRTVFYGASAIPLAQLKKSIKFFKCKFCQFAGLTEVTGHLSALRPEDHVIDGSEEQIKRLNSAGREAIGLETRIVDEQGKECPPGASGEEIVRGGSVMAGYWKMPEETQKTIKDGWLYTGDICVKDKDGYIYYVDRSKDMIVRGGENIYPREVEEVISEHPSVLEVAVIGVPDEIFGEEVKAVIALMPGHEATEDEIIEFCKKRMASFKKPRNVEFVKEIPKNPTGKILKRVLRESYNQS